MFQTYQVSSSTKLQATKKPKRVRSHVPHHKQPAHRVHRRNARERYRTDEIKETFDTLRQLLPLGKHRKRVSKENILKYATSYIRELAVLVREHDAAVSKMADGRRYEQDNGRRVPDLCPSSLDQNYVGCLQELSSDDVNNPWNCSRSVHTPCDVSKKQQFNNEICLIPLRFYSPIYKISLFFRFSFV